MRKDGLLWGDKGLISLEMDGPLPGPEPGKVNRDFSDDFSDETFSTSYNFLRNPNMEHYKRDTGNAA